MIETIRAEWRKTFRRPAFRVVAVLVAVLPVIVYGADYYGALHSGEDPVKAFAQLYPDQFVSMIISAAFPLGAALALVLGTLYMGSEYSWSTLKTLLTQRPQRLTVFAGRFVTFQIWTAIIVVLLFASAAASSVAVAIIRDHAISWPAAVVIVKAVSAAWFTLVTYGSFGVLLGLVFRQAAVALGVGLIYVAMLESILVNFLNSFNGGQLKWIADLLDAQNAIAMLQSFSSSPLGRSRPAPVDLTRAVVAVGIYLCAFAVASAYIFRQRDVA